MTRLLLVRHAKAAASWDEHDDPGLSPLGRRQAEQLAARLPVEAGTAVTSSPLARARATAAPIGERQGRAVRLDVDLGEIPTPPGRRASRGAWLRELFERRWPDVEEAIQGWRGRVLEALAALEADSVVVTHFVAINVAVGAATHQDQVSCCSPAHCSVTEFDQDRGGLRLVEAGAEARTEVG
jgi:broad specificity phosphatase PhoE